MSTENMPIAPIEPSAESQTSSLLKRVAMGSFLASAVGTAAAQGVPAIAENWPLTYNQSVNFTTTSSSGWTRTIEQGTTASPETTKSVVSLSSSETANIMPWAKDFRLRGDTARLEDAKRFKVFVDEVATNSKQGMDITSIEVYGYSSDEVERPNGGLGNVQPENIQLAKDRGAFVASELLKGLDMRGVPAPAEITIEGHERILTPDQINQVKAIAANHKQSKDLGAFIRQYNTNQLKLSKAERETLDQLFKQNRGPEITVGFSKKTVETAPGQATDVCSEVYTLNQTTHEHKGDIPFLFIPAVIPRRRKDGTKNEEAVPEPEQSSANHAPERNNYVQRLDAYDTALDNWVQFPLIERVDALMAADPSLTWGSAMRMAEKERGPMPKMSHYLAPRNWKKRAAIASFALGAAATIAPQFGYCPEPTETRNTPKLEANVPERLSIGLRIPFTDLKTGQLVIHQEVCPDLTSIPKANVCTPQQTVERIYRDGKLIHEEVQPVRK